MNWYAYKALADSYDADRRRLAADHRQARQVARGDRWHWRSIGQSVMAPVRSRHGTPAP